MIKAVASFVFLILFSYSVTANGNEIIKTITDKTQIHRGFYNPPPLSDLVSEQWPDAIRLEVDMVFYEIFTKGWYKDKYYVSNDNIFFVRKEQIFTEEIDQLEVIFQGEEESQLISIKEISLKIKNPSFKKEVEEFELNNRLFLSNYSPGGSFLGAPHYTIEVYNSRGYSYSFNMLFGPAKGRKEKAINGLLNIVNKLESIIKIQNNGSQSTPDGAR